MHTTHHSNDRDYLSIYTNVRTEQNVEKQSITVGILCNVNVKNETLSNRIGL